MPGWMKTRKSCEYADTGERTFRDWLKEGLKHVRYKGTIYVKPEWIDEFLERHIVNENEVEKVVDEVCRELGG